MIEMFQTMVAGSRGSTGSAWEAWAEVAGMRHRARSRHGAPSALARILVAEDIADQPVEVRTAGVAGVMKYRSLHGMAKYTYSEGTRAPLRRVRYEVSPEWGNSLQGDGQNRGESVPDGEMGVRASYPNK